MVLKAEKEGEEAAERRPKTRKSPKRDAAATRQRLLDVAVKEFCAHGLTGARTATIAGKAKCNIRMLYHYFGNKDGLYLAALESVYAQLRKKENDLELLHLEPVEAMMKLVDFTFDHMIEHQEFIRMIGIENLQQGKFLKTSEQVPTGAVPLMKSIDNLLRRGRKDGLFRKGVNGLQLYVSILSLSYVHLSNRHTLSITFGQDLSEEAWLKRRRKHVRDMVLAYLCPDLV